MDAPSMRTIGMRVGTRCGVGRMRGPRACPRPVGLPTHEHIDTIESHPPPGQAQGPFPSTPPPLVPTPSQTIPKKTYLCKHPSVPPPLVPTPDKSHPVRIDTKPC